MNVPNTLRRPGYLALTAMLGIAFFALYTFFDLREGGRDSNLTTTRLGTPAFYIDAFGAPFFYGSVVLNTVLSALGNRDRLEHRAVPKAPRLCWRRVLDSGSDHFRIFRVRLPWVCHADRGFAGSDLLRDVVAAVRPGIQGDLAACGRRHPSLDVPPDDEIRKRAGSISAAVQRIEKDQQDRIGTSK